MGGMVEAIERGYPQAQIAESAYRFQREVESGERVLVGVNAVRADEDARIGTLYIDESTGALQLAALQDLRRGRDAGRVERALDALRAGAAGRANTMPLLVDAVRASATVGEMCDALRQVFGEYVEAPAI